MRNTGASLLELMVVVAIIGILAAGGSMMYAKHLVKARFAKATDFVFIHVNAAKNYFNLHGEFPNLAQLGLTTYEGSTDGAPFDNGLITEMSTWVDPASGCPNRTYTVNFSNLSPSGGIMLGFTGTTITGYMNIGLYALPSGLIETSCYYSINETWGEMAVPYRGAYYPGCYNLESDWEWNNTYQGIINQCPAS